MPASSGRRTGERTSLGFDCSVLRSWIVKQPRCGPRLEPGWARKRRGAGPHVSARGRCRAGARAGLERQNGISSRGARHLHLPLATTQPVDGARLISGYGAVRLRGGQLDGSSAGQSGTLIRCAPRVQVPAVLRLASVMASITGFYRSGQGSNPWRGTERRWRNRKTRFPSKETTPGSSPGRRTPVPSRNGTTHMASSFSGQDRWFSASRPGFDSP